MPEVAPSVATLLTDPWPCSTGGTAVATASIPVEAWQAGASYTVPASGGVIYLPAGTYSLPLLIGPGITVTGASNTTFVNCTTSTTAVPGFWNAHGTATFFPGTPAFTAEYRELTPEERAQQAERWAEEGREREAARERALELMGHCLGEDQLATYREHGWFEVTGSRGRRWRIRDDGQAGNVDLMPEAGEECDATYCAHPPDGLPDPDAHLAQALVLMTDEDAFLRVANLQYRRAA